jgi:hypothetical protein
MFDAASLCSKQLSGISPAYTEPNVTHSQPPALDTASEGRALPVIFSDGLPNPERLLAFLACHSASNPDPVTCSAETFEWPWIFAQGERVTTGADCDPSAIALFSNIQPVALTPTGINVSKLIYIRRAEAGSAPVRAAGQGALLLHAVQGRLGRCARGEQAGCQAEGN